MEQAKTNEKLKLMMYHLEMLQDMIRDQISHFDFDVSYMLINFVDRPTSSQGSFATMENDGNFIFKALQVFSKIKHHTHTLSLGIT